jgi:hypothetical protein
MTATERHSVPKYDYGKTGLDVVVQEIWPGPQVTYEGRVEFSPLDRDHESRARVQNAVADGPQREGRLGIANIPPAEGADTGALEVYQYPWSGHVNGNEVGIAEATSLAARNPGSRLVIIDSPATGGSKRLESSISREIAKTGSYVAYAELAVEALEQLLRDHDNITYSGSSQGARRAVAMAEMMAEMLGKTTKELLLQDPVGSHEQTIRALAKGMMREWGHSANYIKASPDEESKALQTANDSRLQMIHGFGALMGHLGVWNQFVREPGALAQAGFGANLSRALPYVTDAVIINTPELSELTYPSDAEAALRDAVDKLEDKSSGNRLRAQHRILERQTHSMFAGNPGALGQLLVRDLRMNTKAS